MKVHWMVSEAHLFMNDLTAIDLRAVFEEAISSTAAVMDPDHDIFTESRTIGNARERTLNFEEFKRVLEIIANFVYQGSCKPQLISDSEASAASDPHHHNAANGIRWGWDSPIYGSNEAEDDYNPDPQTQANSGKSFENSEDHDCVDAVARITRLHLLPLVVVEDGVEMCGIQIPRRRGSYYGGLEADRDGSDESHSSSLTTAESLVGISEQALVALGHHRIALSVIFCRYCGLDNTEVQQVGVLEPASQGGSSALQRQNRQAKPQDQQEILFSGRMTRSQFLEFATDFRLRRGHFEVSAILKGGNRCVRLG